MICHPLHQSYEALPVAMCIISEGRLAYANAAWSEVFRVPREEVIGKDLKLVIQRLVGAEDLSWVQQLYARPQSEATSVGEVWVRLSAADGRVPLVNARGIEGPGPGERLYVLLPADVEASVRKLAESLTLGAERLLRCRSEAEVLETAVQVVFENELGAAVLFVNGEDVCHGPLRLNPETLSAAEAIYGMPMSEVRLPRALLPGFDEAFRTRRAVFHHDFRTYVAPAHHPKFAEIVLALPVVQGVDAPLFVDGVPFGILSAIGPRITPTMRAALEMFARQVSAAIESARHHKCAEEQVQKLQSLQSELISQARLAVLGEAAGVLAHEVRNPLGAIINGLTILAREPALTDDGGRILTMVEEEAQRIERLVNDLLDFTRPLGPRFAPLELNEVARSAVALLCERKENQTVEVEYVTAQGDHPVDGDGHLLQLAVGNLLRNAVQASPSGGRVRLSVVSSGGWEQIVVEDQGGGIEVADLGRIFEPFFTTRAKGTGLGLPIVQRVAKAHGGHIAVARVPTGGARFELALPRRS